MKTCLFKYTEKFTTKKWKFSDKYSDIFHISAQNLDCGCSLEPPHQGGSSEYSQSMFLSRNKTSNVYPCKPKFYHIKVWFKGVNIILARFRDVPNFPNRSIGIKNLGISFLSFIVDIKNMSLNAIPD